MGQRGCEWARGHLAFLASSCVWTPRPLPALGFERGGVRGPPRHCSSRLPFSGQAPTRPSFPVLIPITALSLHLPLTPFAPMVPL